MGRYDWEVKLERRHALKRKGNKSFWPFLGLCLVALFSVSLLYVVLNVSGQNDLNSIKPPAVSIPPIRSSGLASAESIAADNNAVSTGKKPQANNPDSVQKFEVLKFEKCAKVRITCVVDGDTIWLEGVKIRIADIDTPEVDQSKCAGEKALGQRATNRLVELLNLGPFEIQSSGPKDEDIYERKLRLVIRDGVSLGELLVSEGLARKWTGKRLPWCGN